VDADGSLGRLPIYSFAQLSHAKQTPITSGVDRLRPAPIDPARRERLNSDRPKTRAEHPATILVVDDTRAILKVLAHLLRDRGHKIYPVLSGGAALRAARRYHPDLILLDINMPDISGYEVCQQLKADAKFQGIPIIFISALSEPWDKVRAFDIGGVDYLTKPFQVEELHARVETHLKLHRLQTELEQHGRALEAARERLKLDLDLAREVQRGFLPPRMPELPGYEFFTFYESAYEVGGDYYDFIPLPENRLAVMLGDVVGKGVVAALLMAKLSADARFCMMTEPEPAAAITKLNDLMHQSVAAARFVTLVAAVLDPTQHTVTLVNAGHPSPLHYHRSTRTVTEAVAAAESGLPLGVLNGFAYHACQIHLEPGDSILAFTDGVIEAVDLRDAQLQMQGVCAALQGGDYTPQTLVEQVVRVVKQFSSGHSQSDDIAVVGFGRTV
jgi:serine phosphatase RsbU (regulator of sigma subunit)